jgi:hypothetical protein
MRARTAPREGEPAFQFGLLVFEHDGAVRTEKHGRTLGRQGVSRIAAGVKAVFYSDRWRALPADSRGKSARVVSCG